MPTLSSTWPKILLGWMLCFAIRLLPWRPPNMEPILALTMPFAGRLGKSVGFLFPALSIVLFDAVTSGLGSWTAASAVTYGLIGIAASWWFSRNSGSALSYAIFSIPAVIVYDLITGVLLGPVLFGMPLKDAFLGQIPFTVNHLLSTIVLALLLSPFVDRWIVRNPRLEWLQSSRAGA